MALAASSPSCRPADPRALLPWEGRWSHWVAAAREVPRGGQRSNETGEPVPFQELLWPLVLAAGRQLRDHHACRPDRVSERALGDLERHLLRRLADASGRCLLLEFQAFQATRALREPFPAAERGRGSRANLEAFLEAMAHGGGLARFFQTYPVLARVLAGIMDAWLAAAMELLKRLARHRADLAAVFANGRALGPVVAIQAGLLPLWALQAGRVQDLSAWGSYQPYQVDRRVWRGLGTDLLDLQVESVWLPPGPAIPRLEGQAVSPQGFVEDLIDGFRRLHGFLSERRSELLADTGPLAAFQGQPVRVILRATQHYRQVLGKVLEPNSLRSESEFARRSQALAALPSGVLGNPRFQPLLAAEAQALQAGDVPYFTLSASGLELANGQGQTLVAGALRQSALESVRQRLAGLNPATLRQEEALIRAAFRFRAEGRLQTLAAGAESAGAVLTGGPLLEEAAALAAQLRKAAVITDTGELGWFTLRPFPPDGFEGLDPAGLHLYAGHGGIGLFLAALARITGDREHRALARAALRPIHRWLGNGTLGTFPGTPHGVAGLGGMVYGLVQAGRLLEEPGPLADASRAAEFLTPGVIADAGAFDILGGCAGTLLALLSLWTATGAQAPLEAAALCGQRLLRGRALQADGLRAWTPARGPEQPGFGHGAAGIAYALLRLSGVTGETGFRAAAEEALVHESALQGRRLAAGAEPGARPPLCAWCSGGPGLALGRVGALELLDTPQVRRDLEAGLLAAARHQPGSPDHLCCGGLGRADLLLEAGRLLSRPDWIQAAQALGAATVAGARARGGYRLWAGEVKLPLPGLFRGLAGVGYGLLRLAQPATVPCVLNLS